MLLAYPNLPVTSQDDISAKTLVVHKPKRKLLAIANILKKSKIY